ncbi:MAG: ankyrin repeat domain-containing protein [Acidobacteria bacterium]|nr:ankyrin repeat domain-containing protein [Acidobacteriota bacterium]
MSKRWLWMLVAVFGVGAHAESIPAEHVRAAAAKSISLLQRTSKAFYKTQGCFSCHHQGLPTMALRVARERGVAVDEATAREVANRAFVLLTDRHSIDTAVQNSFLIDPSMSDGYMLSSAHDVGLAANLTTAIYARRLANWQRADGHWKTIDLRPPQSHSVFTATAIAMRAVQLYMPEGLKAERDERVKRAKQWLLSTAPRTTEERTSRLLGLAWAGDSEPDLRKAAENLLAQQRPDGGWAPLPSRSSDAYATGEVLVALARAGGIPTAHPAWQRGLRYLLGTQKEDGSWLVQTRLVSPAPVSPPYFESGFPYGHSQFISAAGTSWAVMALLLALPEAPNGGSKPLPVSDAGAHNAKPWMETALFGSGAELKTLLDRGLDVNSKTDGGTSLLMMAANDEEKVRLLIERGADVKAKAKTGFTALMAACLFRGTSGSVRLLLEKGAEVNPGKEILFNASPLFFAAFAGDRENVALLKEQRGDLQRRMMLLGQFPNSPLFMAASQGDAAMVKGLLQHGANVHEQDEFQMTALDWAVLGNHAAAVRALIQGGAKLNDADKFGYTPLLYAATIDFGDTEVVETLLKAGADPNIRNKEGKSALAQARRYPYPSIRRVLEASGASE